MTEESKARYQQSAWPVLQADVAKLKAMPTRFVGFTLRRPLDRPRMA